MNQLYNNNRYNIILDEKLRLEFDLNQKSESANKQITEMRGDIETIQNSLNEK